MLALALTYITCFYFDSIMNCVMLFALKEDNITANFCLCHLSCVLSMIIKFLAIFTSVHLYTIIICTGGMAVHMCPCILLAIA